MENIRCEQGVLVLPQGSGSVGAPHSLGPILAPTWTLQNPQPHQQPTTRKPALPEEQQTQRRNDTFPDKAWTPLSAELDVNAGHSPQATP